MQATLLDDREIDFLLYEFLNTESLLLRPRYAAHSREIFNAALATAKSVATRYFADHNTRGDSCEPEFDGANVKLIPETKIAWDAFAEAGFLAGHYDFEDGGMQMPEVVMRTIVAYFNAANVSTTGYPFLTIAAGNVIHSFGSSEQKSTYLTHMQSGRFSGTMALTEPGQGSSLGDIRTTARQIDGDHYALRGQKMYISGGDHSLTENIIHLVLARIEGAPQGAKGISLFICPKFAVAQDGTLGARNDVALAGLLHKMGYRNTTSTILSFGEESGADAFLVGERNRGLDYMFQMMNEARIGVGLGAAVLGYQGFKCSLAYAQERPQGRRPSEKDPNSSQINIIGHADVRRMLLAQKVYAEGSLALCLYASSLFEDSRTLPGHDERLQSQKLLDLLTPVVKSWPAKYALAANDLAIQVLGGSGYTRDYPVEQYYRDNRLNPIHEGTEAMHGLDLLGRKVTMGQGGAFDLLTQQIHQTVAGAEKMEMLQEFAAVLKRAMSDLSAVTGQLKDVCKEDPDLGLANATEYLDLFGRVVVAWIWLRQAIVAAQALDADDASSSTNFYRGKIHATRYFYQWELPKADAQISLLKRMDDVPLSMRESWF